MHQEFPGGGRLCAECEAFSAQILVAGHKSAAPGSPERFPLPQLYITVILLSFHSVWALSGGLIQSISDPVDCK